MNNKSEFDFYVKDTGSVDLREFILIVYVASSNRGKIIASSHS